jgi:hypothetical protein
MVARQWFWLRYRRALPLESVSRFRLVSVTVFDQAAANSFDAFLKDVFALAQSAALAVSSLAAASLVLLQALPRSAAAAFLASWDSAVALSANLSNLTRHSRTSSRVLCR